MKKGPYFKWTPEATERLRRLVGTMDSHAIAVEMGCSYSSVVSRLRDLHIRTRPSAAPPARKNMRWTPERLEELRCMAAEGLSTRKIAAHFGRTTMAIAQIVKHWRIELMTKLAIAARTRPSAPRVCQSKRWGPQQIEELRCMAAEGLSARQIADRVGRTPKAITRISKRWNIKLTKNLSARAREELLPRGVVKEMKLQRMAMLSEKIERLRRWQGKVA